MVGEVLFRIGPLRVYSYGFAIALAFGLGTWLAVREAKRRGIPPENMMDLALIVMMAGIIGSRILFVLLELPYYLADPKQIILGITAGGLSLHGGLAGGILAGIWYCRRHNLDPWELADVIAVPLALGVGIVRLGCLSRGCCYGVPAAAPWGLDCSLLHDTLRYPTQLYESALGFILFFFLYRARNHRHFKGYLMFQFIGWYSVIRFVVEFWRDSPVFLGPLKLAQVASIVLAALAFGLIPYFDRKRPVRTSGSGQART